MIYVESYQSDICRFKAMTLSPLHLVANGSIIRATIYTCCFISKI